MDEAAEAAAGGAAGAESDAEGVGVETAGLSAARTGVPTKIPPRMTQGNHLICLEKYTKNAPGDDKFDVL